jgi:hypothetical protein
MVRGLYFNTHQSIILICLSLVVGLYRFGSVFIEPFHASVCAAKRQRTIQVMELGDIPKPKNQNRQPVVKSRNSLRNWANGRR